MARRRDLRRANAAAAVVDSEDGGDAADGAAAVAAPRAPADRTMEAPSQANGPTEDGASTDDLEAGGPPAAPRGARGARQLRGERHVRKGRAGGGCAWLGGRASAPPRDGRDRGRPEQRWVGIGVGRSGGGKMLLLVAARIEVHRSGGGQLILLVGAGMEGDRRSGGQCSSSWRPGRRVAGADVVPLVLM